MNVVVVAVVVCRRHLTWISVASRVRCHGTVRAQGWPRVSGGGVHTGGKPSSCAAPSSGRRSAGVEGRRTGAGRFCAYN